MRGRDSRREKSKIRERELFEMLITVDRGILAASGALSTSTKASLSAYHTSEYIRAFLCKTYYYFSNARNTLQLSPIEPLRSKSSLDVAIVSEEPRWNV